MTRSLALLATLAGAMIGTVHASAAADVKVLTAGAFRQIVVELAPPSEKESGIRYD